MSNEIENIYQSLYRKMKTIRSQNSLKVIHKICQEHKNSGSTDFRISTIARLGIGRGAPSKQTLANSGGQNYRILIQAWQDSAPKSARTQPSAGDWISEIKDSRLRFLVEDLYSRLKKLERENLEFSKVPLEIDLRGVSPTNAGPDLIDSEWDALKLAIDNKFLENMGWHIDHRGSVSDASGALIYRNGYATAIEKLLSVRTS